MMKSFVYVVLVLLLSPFAVADRTVQGTLSSNSVTVDGTADGVVTVNLGPGNTPPTLMITASAITNIGINIVASGGLSLALPSGEGITGLSLATYVGLDITSSNSTASVTLTLITVDLTALFTAGTQVAGIIYADGSAYVRIPATTVNGRLTANLPSVGVYVFVSIDETVTATYAVPRAVIAGVNRTYQWGSNLAIKFLSTVSNSITVVQQTNLTVQGSAQQRSSLGIDLGVYFDISLSASGAAHVSTIQFVYTDILLQAHDVAVSAANQLRWAFYDTVNAAWTFADSSGASVDVSAKVVSQTTTHFSSWGVFYANSNTSNTASSLLLSWISVIAILAAITIV